LVRGTIGRKKSNNKKRSWGGKVIHFARKGWKGRGTPGKRHARRPGRKGTSSNWGKSGQTLTYTATTDRSTHEKLSSEGLDEAGAAREGMDERACTRGTSWSVGGNTILTSTSNCKSKRQFPEDGSRAKRTAEGTVYIPRGTPREYCKKGLWGGEGEGKERNTTKDERKSHYSFT